MGQPDIVNALDSITKLSGEQPVLLVCLRPLGCTFSRDALADLQAHRSAIERAGVRIVVTHLEPPSQARALLDRYNLGDVATISDPTAAVYEWSGLTRGRLGQLIGPRVLWRWLVTALVRRRGAGWTGADVRRMPGVFLVERGRIVRAFRHTATSDRPDYVGLSST